MSRNQFCPCGSGERYKHCCGNIAKATRDDATGIDPLGTLHKALSAQKQGQLALSEALYHAALQAMPGHFDALHMLGVVKFQLGKFEEAIALMLGAFPLVPDDMRMQLRHNFVLSLIGLAEKRGMLDALTQEPARLLPPAPFVRAHSIPAGSPLAPEGISVIVSHVTTPSALSRTLEGFPRDAEYPFEVVSTVPRDGPLPAVLRPTLGAWGGTGRIVVGDDSSLASQINAAAQVCSGDSLCFMRAGDRGSPRWIKLMIAAMRHFGAQWGCSGIRIIDDDGSIVRFGTTPDADALLRAQDQMYLRRTPSLAFMSFNPVGAGRNLIVKKALWSSSGGIADRSPDAFLDWAWQTAQREEPLYLDDPAYLIPAGTEGMHLQNCRTRMIAATSRSDIKDAQRSSMDGVNSYLRHGAALFWAKQWQMIRALNYYEIPSDVLMGCAAMLGVAPTEFAIPLAA